VLKLAKKCGSREIKPGLTGLAVVNGRDSIPIKEKAEYDRIYVFEYRPFMDLIIILKTFGIVLSFRGGN
jgi:O-antigen biosynthesis protein WbqP